MAAAWATTSAPTPAFSRQGLQSLQAEPTATLPGCAWRLKSGLAAGVRGHMLNMLSAIPDAQAASTHEKPGCGAVALLHPVSRAGCGCMDEVGPTAAGRWRCFAGAIAAGARGIGLWHTAAVQYLSA